ncbi:MAG: response regulator transcription factor [Pirellulales bacterium]|nr:response regulator transcription factor [Pirellulales bacterium]
MAAFSEPIVYVIDDDAQSGRAVAELVRTFGHQVRTFQNPREFVEQLDGIDQQQVGCVITDLRMSGVDGMEVLQRILDREVALPVIIVTAYAETAVTVRALRRGAVAVLDKPFRDDELWSFVQEALGRSEQEVARNQRQRELLERFTRLSPQDRQVLQLILEGCKNRTMAKRLDVSLRTIENRRRRVFDMMQADSVAELTRMVVEFEHRLPPTAPTGEAWLTLPFERVA